jgi:protein FRG1
MSYSVAKSGKLTLKGESSSSNKHKKSKKRKSEESQLDARLEDELNHAGGWSIEKSEQLTGTIFIEFTEFMYMHALDNGVFVLGKI